jgi:H+/Cl- antiporter ClcA
MREINKTQFIMLVALSFLASLTALVVDELVAVFNGLKLKGDNRTNYLIWILSSMFFAALAQSCIKYISPAAAGSGIP